MVVIGHSQDVRAQKSKKGVHTWYLYKEGKNSFKDIEPYKDIIQSLSIFGNPSKSFIDACHQNDIEVYIAAGGEEGTINTPEKRKKVTDSYVEDCLKHGYDGVDLDLEGLNPGIESAYTAFLKEASAKLHKIHKKLSHCVGFYYFGLDEAKKTKMFHNPKVLAATCDVIRVMCYDLHYAPAKMIDTSYSSKGDGRSVGPTATYSFVKDAMKFWLKLIPKDKLIMGLPAYSNDYVIGGKGAQVYASVPEDIKGTLPAPTWLWHEKVNLYEYKDVNNRSHLFYASDAKSTAALLELADDLGINKIGFWHLISADVDMWQGTRKWAKGESSYLN